MDRVDSLHTFTPVVLPSRECKRTNWTLRTPRTKGSSFQKGPEGVYRGDLDGVLRTPLVYLQTVTKRGRYVCSGPGTASE